MTANERDSGIAVVHGCFPEGGDSILSAFSWEPLKQSHDQPGCARAITVLKIDDKEMVVKVKSRQERV